ncbi:MAG: ATP synthase F0 subunit A [Bdellovibrio sp. CG10_big_fil_rev_8_21_14_0_10_47_8]|nr:MAG: ATP synthase F0 subunit A [Bdellovibrio sp. CG10_big_fil_rev_8_21_14_0_10_47_8]
MSFTFTSLIPGVGHEYAHVATAGIVTGGLVLASFSAKRALGTGDAAVVPAARLSLRGLMELITEFIAGLCDMVIGHGGRKYVPMFASFFTFVLVNNLVGVIPGMAPATENLNTSLAMGLFVFIAYNLFGFKENGIVYLKHFLGPVLWLGPLMLVIELISHVVRPISLGLRLANVLQGDHTVLAVFLDLVPIGVPIPFYLLGIFVCVVQAFVFTLLSMVYVALATAHDH